MELNEFMSSVEKKAPRVYSEDNMVIREVLYMLAPIFGGIIVSIIALFSFPFIASEEDFLILLLAIGIPPGIGLVLMLVIAFKLSKRAANYGLRGVSRNLISVTILFLDTLLEGYLDTGRIIEEQSPEELKLYASGGFFATRFALKRLDPENYKIHDQLFKEKKQANKSLREKVLDHYASFVFLLIAGLIVAAIALQSLNLLPEYLTTIALTLLIVIGILLICIMGIHLRKKSESGLSEELERAVLEPDLKTETQYILDKLLITLVCEGEHPLRLLTIGEHNLLTYTGNTYLTSRGIMLKEAVLIPKCFNK